MNGRKHCVQNDEWMSSVASKHGLIARRGRLAYCKSPQNSLPRRASNRLSNISFSYWIIRDFSFILLITKNIKNHSVWKITEKVSFYIASATSYVYILSGQKFIKKWSTWGSFENLILRSKVLPNRSLLKVQKLTEMP